MMRWWWVVAVAVAVRTPMAAQGSAGELALYESQRIVDMPTAGMLPRGAIAIRVIAFEQGGVLSEVIVSPLSQVQLGLGYSGTGIIGSGAIRWQGTPALHLRWRILDETLLFPAIAIGLETLGRGSVSGNSFATPAPGAFIAASKQFRWWLGGCAVHGGVGYGFDLRFNGRTTNAWLGIEQSLGRSVAVSFEVNPGSIEHAMPLLFNAVVRWSVIRGATLEFYARDLGARMGSQPTRALGIECIALLSQVIW